MFQFTPSSGVTLWIHVTSHENLPHAGFPIQKSVDRCIFAAPHGLSQLVTSFIGDWCQGIHPALLVTWPCAICTCLHLRLWFSIFRHLIIQNTLMKNSFPQDLRFLCAFVLRMQDLISIFLLFVLLLVFLCSFQGADPILWQVVETRGVEPLTSCLQGRRSPNWAMPPCMLRERDGPRRLNRKDTSHGFCFLILTDPEEIFPRRLGIRLTVMS